MLQRLSMLAPVLALAALLSACELTVRIGTILEGDGSGEFSLAMQLDRELVEGLEQAAASDPDSDLSTLEALFDDLAATGWMTTRSEPAGGLLLRARRPFADSEDFDRALAELAGAGGRAEQPVGLGGLDLDHRVERSFLRTSARFSGRIDLSLGDEVEPIVRQLADALADAVHFEIGARLPGSATVEEGGGTIEGDEIVWRPQIGTVTRFQARSSQIRTSSLLLIVLPALILLAISGWLIAGRRRRHERPSATHDEDPSTEEFLLPRGR